MDYIIAFLIMSAIASVVAELMIRLFRWLDACLHPEQCPLCKMDIEHLDTCFGCPFVVVDEWYECENADCCFKEPCAGHCGLKDKKFMDELRWKHAQRLVEKM